MGAPLFVVPVKDLERGEREVEWEIPQNWLEQTLAETEASVEDGPGRLSATLSKNGREVVVRGRVTARLTMPCARTLEPVPVPIDADLMLLLSPPTLASQGPGRAGKKKRVPGGKPEKDEVLTNADAARDTYDGEQVVLDEFVREFILLELPMVVTHPDLRPDAEPAISPPPNASGPGEADGGIDPRLAPLAEIASRLRKKE